MSTLEERLDWHERQIAARLALPTKNGPFRRNRPRQPPFVRYKRRDQSHSSPGAVSGSTEAAATGGASSTSAIILRWPPWRQRGLVRLARSLSACRIAWEAAVLPLNYARKRLIVFCNFDPPCRFPLSNPCQL
jgi:hypothetical protein